MFNKSDVSRWLCHEVTLQPSLLSLRIVIIIVALAAILYIFTPKSTAQDAAALKCDAELMQGFQSDLDEQNQAIAEAAATGDVITWLDLLRQSRLAYAVIDAHCRGMSFSNETDGQQPVLGPLLFADGVWKSTFATEGMGQVQFEIISGDCDQFTTMLLYNGGFSSEFASGAGNTFTTADLCTAMVKVGLVDKPWTLMFELVAPAQ